MRNSKVKIVRTLDELDRRLEANDFRASGYLSLEVTDQLLGGRVLYDLVHSRQIESVEMFNEYGKKENVFRSKDVKKIALRAFC
jgi:hypothetical protein